MKKEKGMDREAEFKTGVNPACEGLRRHRLKDNPLEFAFAEQWSREVENGLANYILARNLDNEKEYISLTDQVIANTIIQWLGTPVGQAFLVSVFKRPEAVHFLDYMMAETDIRERVAKYLKSTSW